MSIYPQANATIRVLRATALVLDSATLAASHAPSRQPVRAATVSVYVGGAPTGTVVVTGTVGGTPGVTETLTWAGTPGWQTTSREYTAISGFTSTVAGGTTVQAKALGRDGSPQLATYTVRGPGLPVTMEETQFESLSQSRKQGTQEEGVRQFRIQYEEVWRPRIGDRIVVDGMGVDDDETYEVLEVRTLPNRMAPSEWACRARQFDGKATT